MIMDKFDKIGKDEVFKELIIKGFNSKLLIFLKMITRQKV